MTEHYTVDTGSTLRAWDIYAYTQAVVEATKAGKEIEVDSAVKIGNVYEVKYSVAVVPKETPEEVVPEETPTGDVEDEAPPAQESEAETPKEAAEPPKKAPTTRRRRSTKAK